MSDQMEELSVRVGMTPRNMVHVHIADSDGDVAACYSLGWLEAVRFAACVVSMAQVGCHLSGSDYETFQIVANSSLKEAHRIVNEQYGNGE